MLFFENSVRPVRDAGVTRPARAVREYGDALRLETHSWKVVHASKLEILVIP